MKGLEMFVKCCTFRGTYAAMARMKRDDARMLLYSTDDETNDHQQDAKFENATTSLQLTAKTTEYPPPHHRYSYTPPHHPTNPNSVSHNPDTKLESTFPSHSLDRFRSLLSPVSISIPFVRRRALCNLSDARERAKNRRWLSDRRAVSSFCLLLRLSEGRCR